MELKKRLNLNTYEWWRNHRKVIMGSGLIILFGWYINPVIEQARLSNEKSKSIWLVIHSQNGGNSFSEKVEMKDLAQCQEQGRRWKSNSRTYLNSITRSYACIEGN